MVNDHRVKDEERSTIENVQNRQQTNEQTSFKMNRCRLDIRPAKHRTESKCG